MGIKNKLSLGTNGNNVGSKFVTLVVVPYWINPSFAKTGIKGEGNF